MASRQLRTRHPHLQRREIARSILLACTAMGAGLAAHAQSAAPAAAASAPAANVGLEAIVVTARKREEQAIDVPISLKTFSGQGLRAQGANDLQDIRAQAGFTLIQTSGTVAGGRAFGLLTFRGLSGDGGQAFENSGALFIDGIFVSGGASTVNFADAARVEVLKGPQNAFFGRSTFGGAINVVTRNPANKLQGQVNSTLGSRGSTDVDATIEGPLLPDLLTGRVTVLSRNKAAVARASDGGDLGAEKTKSATGTLFLTPTDNLWVRLRGHYQKDEDSAAAIGAVLFNGNTSCNGRFYPGTNASGASQPFTPAQPYACGGVPKLGDPGVLLDANTALPASVYNAFVNNSLNAPFLSDSPRLDHSGMARESMRASLQSSYKLPNEMDLAVNLGHNEVNTRAIWDLDRSPTQNFLNVMPILTKDTTFDARLTTDPSAKVRGLLGASYFKSSYQLSQVDLNAAFGATAPTVNTTNYNNFSAEVPAAYGSVEYDVTDQLTLSGDVRYQVDKITSTSFAGATFHNESKNWLPRLIVRFMPQKNITTYFSASEGVQPLTTNAGYTAASAAGKSYIAGIIPGSSDFSPQPKLKALELGLKQQVGDWLQYSLAGYDQRWDNRLTNSFLFNPSTCTVAQALTPACPLSASGSALLFANQARVRGIELSVDASPTQQWIVGGTLDYKRARWSRYVNSSVSALTGGTPATTTSGFDGNTIAKVPEWTASVNTTFRTALGGGWTGYARGDFLYVGRAWDTDFNIIQGAASKRLNLRIGAETPTVTLELFVKNALDDRNWTSQVRSADLTFTPLNNFNRQLMLTGVADPREFGVRTSLKF